MDETIHSHAQIDDRYLAEWLEFGFREMSAYLDKQARFARYLNDRDADLQETLGRRRRHIRHRQHVLAGPAIGPLHPLRDPGVHLTEQLRHQL
jgi:hypothetical protein